MLQFFFSYAIRKNEVKRSSDWSYEYSFFEQFGRNCLCHLSIGEIKGGYSSERTAFLYIF